MDILTLPVQKSRYLLVGLGLELSDLIECRSQLGQEIRPVINQLLCLYGRFSLPKRGNP